MQVTQQIFVTEEWIRDTRNEARAEAHSRAKIGKSLGALKQEQIELANKLTASKKACLSAEAFLKSTEAQAEDQRKQLHLTEIELATQRQLVLDLKAESKKAKDAARVARETSKAVETASYECWVLKTEARLAKEVTEVCRDYCVETWVEVLNRAGVPTDSELRRAENIFLLEDIREVPATLPPPVADLIPPLELLPTTQSPPLDAEVSTGAEKGKEAQPSGKTKDSEDTLTIKDMVSQAKDAEPKSKAGGSLIQGS